MNYPLAPDTVIATALRLQVELDLWWGHSRLGLILCAAFFNAEPVTSEQMGDLMGISPETVRRHLKPLINIGRALVVREGRNVRYIAHEDWAGKTRDIAIKAWVSGSPATLPKRLVPFELSENLIVIGGGDPKQMVPVFSPQN